MGVLKGPWSPSFTTGPMDPHYVHCRACATCTIDVSLVAAASPETVWWMAASCCGSLTTALQSSWALSGLPAHSQPWKISSQAGRGSEAAV